MNKEQKTEAIKNRIQEIKDEIFNSNQLNGSGGFKSYLLMIKEDKLIDSHFCEYIIEKIEYKSRVLIHNIEIIKNLYRELENIKGE